MGQFHSLSPRTISQAFGFRRKSSMYTWSRCCELPEFFSFLLKSPPLARLISLLISLYSALSGSFPCLSIYANRALLDRCLPLGMSCLRDPHSRYWISVSTATEWVGPAPRLSQAAAVTPGSQLPRCTLFSTRSSSDPLKKHNQMGGLGGSVS